MQKNIQNLITKAINVSKVEANKNGNLALVNQSAPKGATCAKCEKRLTTGTPVNFWVSASGEARIYGQAGKSDGCTCSKGGFFRRKGSKLAPKPAPKPARKQKPAAPKPAPALVGASGTESMDDESVHHIVATAKQNGAKSVVVAIVRF